MGLFDAIGDFIHDLVDGPGGKPSLADLGADPDQVAKVPGADGAAPGGAAASGPMFPNASGSPVMDQVNKSMEVATENHREGMEIAKEAPTMESAGDQAQNLIHGVMNADPDDLAKMAGQAEGRAVAEEIHTDVARSHQDLLDRKSLHETKLGADRAQIEAEGVEKAARDAIAKAKDLG